eukprot:gene7999-9394_t
MDSSIDSELSASQISSFIGINVPHYLSKVIIDPDFSVLVDQDTAKDAANSICTKDTKFRTTAKLGVVIITVIVLLTVIILIAAVLLLKRYKYTFKIMIESLKARYTLPCGYSALSNPPSATIFLDVSLPASSSITSVSTSGGTFNVSYTDSTDRALIRAGVGNVGDIVLQAPCLEPTSANISPVLLWRGSATVSGKGLVTVPFAIKQSGLDPRSYSCSSNNTVFGCKLRIISLDGDLMFSADLTIDMTLISQLTNPTMISVYLYENPSMSTGFMLNYPQSSSDQLLPTINSTIVSLPSDENLFANVYLSIPSLTRNLMVTRGNKIVSSYTPLLGSKELDGFYMLPIRLDSVVSPISIYAMGGSVISNLSLATSSHTSNPRIDISRDTGFDTIIEVSLTLSPTVRSAYFSSSKLDRYSDPPYPYGFIDANGVSIVKTSVLYSRFSPADTYLYDQTQSVNNGTQHITTLQIPPPIITSIVNPNLKKLEMIPISSYSFLLRVTVSTALPFKSMEFLRNGEPSLVDRAIYPSSYVSNVTIDGKPFNVYEKEFNFTSTSSVSTPWAQTSTSDSSSLWGFKITDQGENQATFYQGDYYNSDFQKMPDIPFFSIDPLDITSFNFQPNNFDVSLGPVQTVLYFNVTMIDKLATPKIRIFYDNNVFRSLEPLDSPLVFTGAYDPVSDMYRIPIVIKEKSFSGSLDYQIYSWPRSIDPLSLSSIPAIGSRALLNVSSVNADRMPPVIKNLVLTTGTYMNISDATKEVDVLWTFDIEDKETGIDITKSYATISRGRGTTKYFNPNIVRLSGDEFVGHYYFSFKVDPTGGSSNNYTLGFTLCDYIGNCASSNSSYADPIPSISPYIFLNPSEKAQITVQIITKTPVDITAPKVTSLVLGTPQVDITGSSRYFQATLVASDQGYYDPPTSVLLYFTTFSSQWFALPCLYKEMDSTNIKFNCTGQLPYGFGQGGVLYLSVYNIHNAQGLRGGSTTRDLQQFGQAYYLTTKSILQEPYIDSCSSVTVAGGVVTIRGNNMVRSGTTSTFSIDINDGTGYKVVLPIFSSSIVVTIPVPLFSQSFKVKVQTTKQSNELTVYPYVAPSPPVRPTPTPAPTLSPPSCPGTPQCSGRGDYPDFSMLVDEDNAKNAANSICTRDKKFWTSAKLAGVIIAAIVGLAIIILVVAVLLHKRFKYAIKMKLESRKAPHISSYYSGKPDILLIFTNFEVQLVTLNESQQTLSNHDTDMKLIVSLFLFCILWLGRCNAFSLLNRTYVGYTLPCGYSGQSTPPSATVFLDVELDAPFPSITQSQGSFSVSFTNSTATRVLIRVVILSPTGNGSGALLIDSKVIQLQVPCIEPTSANISPVLLWQGAATVSGNGLVTVPFAIKQSGLDPRSYACSSSNTVFGCKLRAISLDGDLMFSADLTIDMALISQLTNPTMISVYLYENPSMSTGFNLNFPQSSNGQLLPTINSMIMSIPNNTLWGDENLFANVYLSIPSLTRNLMVNRANKIVSSNTPLLGSKELDGLYMLPIRFDSVVSPISIYAMGGSVISNLMFAFKAGGPSGVFLVTSVTGFDTLVNTNIQVNPRVRSTYASSNQFYRYSDPPYPYGFIDLEGVTLFKASIVYSRYALQSINNYIYYQTSLSNGIQKKFPCPLPPPTVISVGKPILKKIRMVPISSYSFLLRATIYTSLPFESMEFLRNGELSLVDKAIYPSSYVSTIDIDGITYNIYETEFNFTSTSSVGTPWNQASTSDSSSLWGFKITDQGNNQDTFYQGDYYNADFLKMPDIPFFSIDPLDITSFNFQPNNLDVSLGPAQTVLYFNVTMIDKSATPKIRIFYDNNVFRSLEPLDSPLVFTGAYDPVSDMYRIPIVIKEKSFSGSLDYQIYSWPRSIDPLSLSSVPSIGSRAFLNVSSVNADRMPPVIKNLVLTTGTYMNLTNATKEVDVLWTFDIEDKETGIDLQTSYATVSLGSLTKQYIFSLVRLSGDEFVGHYYFSFKVQTFDTSNNYTLGLVLCDYIGNCASNSSYTDPTPSISPYTFLSPTEMTQRTAQIITSVPVDTTAPKIISLQLDTAEVDITGSSRYFQAIIVAKDEPFNSPPDKVQMYFSTLSSQWFTLRCKLEAMDGFNTNYNCTGQLPYGFGQGGLYLSVYNILNAQGLRGGSTTDDLKESGFPYYLPTKSILQEPYIDSCSSVTVAGGVVTIRGNNMVRSGTTSTFSIDINDGTGYKVVLPIFSSSIVVTIPVPLFQVSFKVKVQTTKQSNELTVYPYVAPSPPIRPTSTPAPTLSPPSCPGSPPCSGRGDYPDFSMLVDEDNAKNADNSICTRDKKFWTSVKLAGVIIAAIVGLAIIILVVAVLLHKRFKYAIKMKLESRKAHQHENKLQQIS